MNEGGFSLGGEQSGHVIMSEYATTGDGLLTGLHLVAEMARTGKTLAELASVMTVYPQVLVNVRGRRPLARCDATRASRMPSPRVAAELGDSGRVLLRPSGTEPMVRVMVEAADAPTRPSRYADAPRRRRAGAPRAVAAQWGLALRICGFIRHLCARGSVRRTSVTDERGGQAGAASSSSGSNVDCSPV